MSHVLIVGGSIAGVRVAEGLRRLKYEGRITILEAGGDLPYDRPALSKQLLTAGAEPSSVMLRTWEDLAKHDIDLRVGRQAVGLDVPGRSVTLADGSTVGYTDLVIATGASPRRLPGASGVRYLRTLNDALELRDTLTGRVVVVGAGFIGSEVAAAASVSATVTVVEPFPVPLGRVVGDQIGKRLARLHEANGVRLLLGRSVSSVDEGAAVLDDGTVLECDVVVAGIGAVPATAWLGDSGLDVADGVSCDEFCQAADHVYAAGDVARWPNPLFGEVMRIEHWTNAVEQAGIVAWNIMRPAARKPYASVPYVWSDQYGSRLQIVGRPRADDEIRIIKDDETMVALFIRNDRLTGAFAMDAPGEALTLRRALAARTPLDEVMASVAEKG